MAQFRKKPVVIDAWKYQHGLQDGDLSQAVIDGKIEYKEDGTVLIDTLEGVMICRNGDYIIRGVKGEYYPCKPDIFAATYEAASDSEDSQPQYIEEMNAVSTALGFFPSVIHCGEKWSSRCEEVRVAAVSALLTLHEAASS